MIEKKKIKVLYISNQGGGAPRSLLNMIKALKDSIEPIVLFENDWYDYRMFMKEGIRCIIVPYRMNLVLNEPSYKTLKWKLHRFIDELLKNKLAAYKVKKLLKGENIDIVHTNTGAITIGISVAKILNAKHIWHLREFQDIDFHGFPYNGWKNFYKSINKSDAIIAISKAIYNHFNLSIHKNSYIIWDGVRSKSSCMFNKDKQNFILYCSSTIYYSKGLHDLLEAYANSELPKKQIYLYVLGSMDKGYYQIIKKIIDKYAIDKYVIFKGQCNNVDKYMSEARCFILPSLNEGLGRVVIEAMFNGCPVIVRNTGGPTEYIKDKINGFIFNTTNELTNLLNYITNNNTEEISLKAQKFVADNFSEEVYGEKILDIYRKLLVNV